MEDTTSETVFEGLGKVPDPHRSRHVDHFGNQLPRDLVLSLASHFAVNGRVAEARELVAVTKVSS